MREIKFRAWDIKRKEFLPDFFIDQLYIRTDGKIVWYSAAKGREIIEDGIFDIQWSTGLLDKNGVEIYEGDIMRIGRSDFIYPGIYEVEYFGGGFRLMRKSWDEVIRHHIGDMPHGNCEVIGNVYSNPELLND
jgi:uncharacterized phage protein (TIGR01671 family)